MKKLQTLLILTILLVGCTTQSKKAIINGEIIDNVNSNVLCSAVFNQTNNKWFQDTIKVDSAGGFKITLDVNEPCFAFLKCESTYTTIIIEPGKSYSVIIDEKIKKVTFKDGKSEAQKYYESLPKSHPNAVSFFKQEISNYTTIYKELMDKLDKEFKAINNLSCSQEVKELVKRDRQVYYNLAISSLASRNNVAYQRKNEQTPSEVMSMWKDAVVDSFITHPITKKTSFYYELLGLAYWYNLYTKFDYDTIISIKKEKREQLLTHTYNIELAKQVLPKEIQEYYTATYIQSTSKQNRFEEELIESFNQFKHDYPQSKHTIYIQPNITKISDFYKKVAANKDVDVELIGKDADVNTLDECLKSFKGKKLYVDIWSTSCGSCKKEFEYNKELKSVLKNNKVEMLYISLDRDSRNKSWEDMIKYYELQGTHIRANKKFKADLRKQFGSFGIPRYLLIDSDGEILNNNAPRPSNLDELKKIL